MLYQGNNKGKFIGTIPAIIWLVPYLTHHHCFFNYNFSELYTQCMVSLPFIFP